MYMARPPSQNSIIPPPSMLHHVILGHHIATRRPISSALQHAAPRIKSRFWTLPASKRFPPPEERFQAAPPLRNDLPRIISLSSGRGRVSANLFDPVEIYHVRINLLRISLSEKQIFNGENRIPKRLF